MTALEEILAGLSDEDERDLASLIMQKFRGTPHGMHIAWEIINHMSAVELSATLKIAAAAADPFSTGKITTLEDHVLTIHCDRIEDA
jgi:hypothetical protein